MKTLLCLFGLFISTSIFSQTLGLDEYLSWVAHEHPMMKNARLLEKKGEAQWLQTKGLFDPVLSSKWKNKFYSDKNYYQQSNTSIEIPTPYAIGLVAQLDFNNGAYVNPNDNVPNNGLMAIGVQLPLLQGLIIDERRMSKQRAQQIKEMAELETTIAINELLFQSTQLYLDWWISEKKLKFQTDLLSKATERHQATRSRFLGGDRSAMDTLESYITQETRKQQLQEVRLENIKYRIAMVAFKDNVQNTDNILQPSITAEENTFVSLLTKIYTPQEIEIRFQQHPELLWYSNKAEVLAIEQKWKREKLKPKLNVEYNFLNKSTASTDYYFSTENYKWGVEFQVPLFLREARGDLQLQQIKIQENDNNLLWKRQQLDQKLNFLQTQQEVMQRQFTIARNNSINSDKLLQGENIKFFNGESAIFLVNQRENYLLDQQLKALDYEKKWVGTQLELRYNLYLPFTSGAQ